MEGTDIVTLLGNGFFPIVMCGLLFWYMTQQNSAHKAEVDGLKDVLNSVQIALTKLEDAITHLGEGKDGK